MYYINCFFLYSIFGYLLETIMYLLFDWNGGSGILFGPWTPVYGFGTIIVIFTTDYIFSHRSWNRWLKRFLTFIIVTILLSIIEYVGGVFIEKIFNITFWDYSNQKFNMGKYISVEMALLWGFLSMIFIYLLRPLSDKIVKKIPKFLTYFLVILIVIDLILTILFKAK